MKRDIFQALLRWKVKNMRKPLILQGARQVGKTYIVESFGKDQFSECLRIDFDKDKSARDIFSNNLDPEQILRALRIRYEKQLIAGESLIIFDEIQECPDALNSLKYFCEEAAEYHLVAAGSLLGVKMSSSKGFPVGKVEFLKLYPMSFLEFLLAIGRDQLHDYLMCIHNVGPIETTIHNDLNELFKVYCYVGGMPEAVQCYVNTSDLLEVRRVQEAINAAYVYDFSKHAPSGQIMKITGIWHSLPGQLAKENKKFKFSLVHKNARLRDYQEALQWLIDAGIIYVIYNNTTPRLPLSGYVDTHAFKVYMLDVGLLGAMSDLSAKSVLEKNTLFTEYKGALMENVAVQLIYASGLKQAHYWAYENKAEIDLLLQVDQHIVPIEIKSGVSRHKKSIHYYMDKYHPPYACRGSQLNLAHDGDIINIPLYFFERALCLLENM